MISLNGTQWKGRRSEAAPAFDLSVMIRRPAAEVFALLADIQDAEPLPRRVALLPWLSGVIAPRLRPHVAERLADIRALLESGA